MVVLFSHVTRARDSVPYFVWFVSFVVNPSETGPGNSGEELGRHDLFDGDFAFGENGEVFELLDLRGETFAGETSDVGGAAGGVAAGDELAIDDQFPRGEG